MLPLSVVKLLAYATEDGKSPYVKWFNGLNAPAAIKITTALERIEDGNFSNAKAVGAGVSECKINFGPDYRIYFGMDGATLIILLCGGSKQRQSDDIAEAKVYWADYKKRKRQETE